MITRRQFIYWLATSGLIEKVTVASAETVKEKPIRAVYLGNSFGVPAKTAEFIGLAESTEINSVVVNTKDDDGRVLLEEPHRKTLTHFKEKGLYVIGRVVVFHDNIYARENPREAALNRGSDGKSFWYDHKKWIWIDPLSKKYINYLVEIIRKSIEAGCDEINLDYIRFPSGIDGNTQNAAYPFFDPNVISKRQAVKDFLSSLLTSVRDRHPRVKFSADVFGYTFLEGKQSGIGQHLEDFAETFDYISPMAYPSHYMCNEFGAPDPNKIPYTVYKRTIESGLRYLTTKGYTDVKIRPWLQGFSGPNIFGCGVVNGKGVKGVKGELTDYRDDPARFREQIRALRDLGIESWMVWNPGAYYNKALFKPKEGP